MNDSEFQDLLISSIKKSTENREPGEILERFRGRRFDCVRQGDNKLLVWARELLLADAIILLPTCMTGISKTCPSIKYHIHIVPSSGTYLNGRPTPSALSTDLWRAEFTAMLELEGEARDLNWVRGFFEIFVPRLGEFPSDQALPASAQTPRSIDRNQR